MVGTAGFGKLVQGDFQVTVEVSFFASTEGRHSSVEELLQVVALGTVRKLVRGIVVEDNLGFQRWSGRPGRRGHGRGSEGLRRMPPLATLLLLLDDAIYIDAGGGLTVIVLVDHLGSGFTVGLRDPQAVDENFLRNRIWANRAGHLGRRGRVRLRPSPGLQAAPFAPRTKFLLKVLEVQIKHVSW
jgi:hypothetical protein